jgi:hypothetical protein
LHLLDATEAVMRVAGTVVAIALAATLGACEHEQGRASMQARGAVCPLANLQGIHATVSDIPGGVAITFTGPTAQVEKLRANVDAMATENDKRGDAFAACSCGVDESSGAAELQSPDFREPGYRNYDARPRSTAYPVTPKPLADSRVEDISTGAVLRLTALDPSRAQALRADTRANVAALQKNCLRR